MVAKLKAAAEWAVLFGVKALIVIVFVLAPFWFVANDYFAMRAAAQHGEAAFQYLQQVVAAQQKAQAAQPVPNSEKAR